MPMTGVNIAINKKQYNSKTISEKTWKEKEENTNNPQTGIKETQSTETETIDLNEEPIEKEEIKAEEEEEETSGGFWGDLWNGAVSVGTSIADGASAAWDATTDFVEDTGAAIASGFNSAVNVVGDIATGALDTVSGFGSMLFDWGSDRLDDIKEFATSAGDVLLKSTEKINEILQATAATNATIILGLVEGIGEFAEAIVDAVAIIGTGVISVFTGAFDLGQAIGAAITGNEWESVTKQMWDGTMGFVSEQWVSGAFDMLYEDTGFGQWIAENAVGFDTVRGISSGIGYVAGMIALTIATCGAGSAPTVASAISSTATEGAIIAGTAGFGQGAEEAWGNGATLGEGLGYAGVKGIYDGVSYFVGGKMSGVVIGEGVSAGSRLLTSTVRVGFDAFDGGLSGFADPAAKMIYNDKSYSESFEENGGWQTVATNTFIGGGMSAFGEITDNIKISKTINNTQFNDSVATTMSTATNSASNKKKNIFGRIKDFFTNKKKQINNSTDIIPHISYKESLIGYIKEVESEIDAIKHNNNNILGELAELKDKAVSATIIKQQNYKTTEEYNHLVKGLTKEVEKGNFYYITNDESYRDRIVKLYNEYNENSKKLHELEQLRSDLKTEYSKLSLDNVSMAKEKLDKLESFFAENNVSVDSDISTFNYGVDQGVVKRNYKIVQEYDSNGKLVTKRKASNDYLRVKQKLVERYNMDYNTAAKVMSGVDSVGACSYAATANEIFASYMGKEQQFFNDFGFSMYVVENGKKRLNSMELLTDMYIYQNMQENGGNLLIRTLDGKTVINPSSISSISDAGGRYNLSGKEQQYMSGSYGKRADKISNYLKSKNVSLNYNSRIIQNNRNYGTVDIGKFQNLIIDEINNGNYLTLGVYNKRNEINFYNMSGGMNTSTFTWNEGGGHAVFITGINDNGVLVSSWGEKYLIPYSDLRDGSFVLNSINISKN